MRQVHLAGEKAFVDWSGDGITITDPVTGKESRAELFVGVLGASNYTYAEAAATQGLRVLPLAVIRRNLDIVVGLA